MSWHVANFALRMVSGYPRNENMSTRSTHKTSLPSLLMKSRVAQTPLWHLHLLPNQNIPGIVNFRIMQTKSIWQNCQLWWQHEIVFKQVSGYKKEITYFPRSWTPLAIPTCSKDPLKIAEMTNSLMLLRHGDACWGGSRYSTSYDSGIWYRILYYEKVWNMLHRF